MYFKEKSIAEWQKILNGLKSIATEVSENKKYVDDRKFLCDSITSLESISEGKTSSTKNVGRVMNLLAQHQYHDIKSGLEMLKGINCFNLVELSRKIEEIGKESGLTGIALNSKHDNEYKKKSTFINKAGYQRYFFTDRSHPYKNIDLLSNGEDSIDISFVNDNFIEDVRRSDSNYRILWTKNFNFNKGELPSKSFLDTIDFELESKKQFVKILKLLKSYKEQGRVQIILSNPNQIFECQESSYDNLNHILDRTYFNTIRADGTILNNEGRVFWPTTATSIANPYLQVKDSNYVVLATNLVEQVEEKEKYVTEFVSIIVNPNWFYSFIDYAIKNDSIDAKTIMNFSSCIATETKEAITPNYKVEIKPTVVKTLNLIKRPNLEQ